MTMLMRARTNADETAFPRLVGSVPAARAVNAVKLYGTAETAVRALDGVNVDFAPGCFTAIMGPSVSG
jgi:putative ABC transport system ATP-binding protein